MGRFNFFASRFIIANTIFFTFLYYHCILWFWWNFIASFFLLVLVHFFSSRTIFRSLMIQAFAFLPWCIQKKRSTMVLKSDLLIFENAVCKWVLTVRVPEWRDNGIVSFAVGACQHAFSCLVSLMGDDKSVFIADCTISSEATGQNCDFWANEKEMLCLCRMRSRRVLWSVCI